MTRTPSSIPSEDSSRPKSTSPLFDLNAFIASQITGRSRSLLADDLEARDAELREQLADRRVLVIGGAGTIGSSFIRALLPYRPAALVVVDINENSLTELTRDLRSREGMYVPDDYRTYPISFAGPVFEKLLAAEPHFHVVANFAAHKHVRSEKDHFSIEAMVRNNVIDAKALLDRLLAKQPERFFCVSTDKAANPVNVMGASKKLMEEAILAYSDAMTITTARFANVAFSNGSLLFGFLERLMRRQPLSAPSDVRRYFVSPDESGQLCLLACVCGASGDIFFPKLGAEQMLTFSTIADRFLAAQGLSPKPYPTEQAARAAATTWAPGQPYPVYYFTSDTSGEKGFEEFYTDEETLDLDSFTHLGVIKDAPRPTLGEVERAIARLRDVFAQPHVSKAAVVAAMTELLPGFAHLETGRGLDQRM